MLRSCLAAMLLATGLAPDAMADDETCKKYEALIESSLQDLAENVSELPGDELNAFLNNTKRPGVVKPALIANAWGTIHAAIAHMPQLGCKPYKQTLDPSAYYAALFKCNADKSKDRPSCKRSTWERKDWADHRR